MKKIFISFLFALSCFSLSSTHIIGGDLYVEHVTGNTFSVTLVMFRDCNPGNFGFPNDLTIEVYEEGTNNSLDALDFDMTLFQVDAIPLGDQCNEPSICLEQGTYQVNMDFPNNTNGYYISWQSCCRNDLIQNIQDPDDVGMVFTCTFPDPALQNSSPVFGNYPSQAYFCVNGFNEFDFGTTDADGDSLVYTLDTPLIGTTQSNPGSTAGPKPYAPVNWVPPYSAADMVGGSPVISIDGETGLLTAGPDMTFVYVFAIKVEEYRNGVKIGEVRREIQFDSFICFTDAPAEIVWDNVSPPDYIIEPNKPFCITIESNDTNFEDTLFLFVDSEVLDTSFFPPASFVPVVGTGQVSSEFCWTPDCSSLRTEPYSIEISSFSTGCTDSTFTSQELFSIIVELPEDEPTIMSFPLSTNLNYIMNGDEHCFFVQLDDVDCYDTLTIYADTTKYSFSQAPIQSSFDPNPPALFSVTGEYCWRPQCPDITFDLQPHVLDFYVDSRKCDVVNTFKYPFFVNVIPESDGNIKLPNIFSPNEDEMNIDFTTFDHTDFCIRQFDLKMFNRWGNIVYSTTDKDFQWDGIHQDTELEVAPGVYYYIINYDVFGNAHTYTGDVTVVR